MLPKNLLDNPLILSVLFHPRPARMGSRDPNTSDGTIPAGEDILIGYRLYAHPDARATLLFFHGNGEIAPDYDQIAPLFHGAGAALLVVDYRGYGWSTGKPLVSAVLPDAEKAAAAVPDILQAAGLSALPLYLMGRSLGSIPAIHLARHQPQAFKGLVIESGIGEVIPLLSRLGLPLAPLKNFKDPFGNLPKMREVDLPLLVIHGERDDLVPISNGEAIYTASPAENKRFLRIPGAGHNDLLFRGMEAYFGALGEFLETP